MPELDIALELAKLHSVRNQLTKPIGCLWTCVPHITHAWWLRRLKTISMLIHLPWKCWFIKARKRFLLLGVSRRTLFIWYFSGKNTCNKKAVPKDGLFKIGAGSIRAYPHSASTGLVISDTAKIQHFLKTRQKNNGFCIFFFIWRFFREGRLFACRGATVGRDLRLREVASFRRGRGPQVGTPKGW